MIEMVKKVCETELGIVSQCVSSRNVPRVKPQYLANLLLKINSKVVTLRTYGKLVSNTQDVFFLFLHEDGGQKPPSS